MRREWLRRVACGAMVLLGGAGACRKEAPAPGVKVEMARSLKCEMSVAPRLRVGEPVEVTFRLGNPTDEKVSVLKWHTPLEGLRNNYLRVTRDGVEVPYAGMMLKRAPPDASDYVTLAPGESATGTVDLTEAYDFQQPGHYRIEFTGELRDVAPKGTTLPRSTGTYQRQQVQCPVVETTLVP